MVRNILIYIFSKSNLRPPQSQIKDYSTGESTPNQGFSKAMNYTKSIFLPLAPRKSKGGNGPTISPRTVLSAPALLLPQDYRVPSAFFTTA